MFPVRPHTRWGERFLALLVVLSFGLAVPISTFAGKKKTADAPPAKAPTTIDYSNIVWPNPVCDAEVQIHA
jgi:hypothetical protein